MIRFDDLSLARAGRPLFSHASLIINPGERVALIGANGSGKSSLLALLRGDLAPEQGNVDLPRLRIAWLAQHAPRASIGPVRFVMNADAALVAAEQAIQQAEARHDGEALGEAYARWVDAGGPSAEARAAELLDGLGFGQAQLARTVDELSGGWKMRLNLACVLMAPSDLLLLDEPTNHLDANTRDALADALAEFEGPLLLVSHDRYLLRSTVDEFWLVDDGILRPFDGDLDDYAQWLQKERSARQRGTDADPSGSASGQAGSEGTNASGSDAPRSQGGAQEGGASGQQGASAGGSRADNRRERAQQRAALAARKKPVEQAIQKIERQMESLQARAATLDEQLAAPDAFADRAAATERQRERAQIATELENLENDWLERQAEIEEIERQAAEG